MKSVPRFVAFLACVACMLADRSAASGQDSDDLTTLHERVNQFFENLDNENVATPVAFSELLAEGPLAGNADIAKLIDKYDEATRQYGEYLEHESVDARLVGKDLALIKYLYKAERFPIVWYFTFYRPPVVAGGENKWMPITVKFDTRLELLGLLPK